MAKKRLSVGDLFVFYGGLLLIISIFLPWFREPSSPGYPGSTDSLIDAGAVIAFLIMALVLVAIGLIVLKRLGLFDLGEHGAPESVAVMAIALCCALLVLLGGLSEPDTTAFASVEHHWGLWVGIVSAMVFITGAVIKMVQWFHKV